MTVAQALALGALPADIRQQILRLVVEAYYAGFDDAKEIARDDKRTGTNWLSVWQARDASCWAFLDKQSEVCGALGVENPINYDEIYAINSVRGVGERVHDFQPNRRIRMPKKEKFPKTIVVTRENSGNETYLAVNDDGVDGLTEEQDVAIYVLDSVSRLKITRELQ